MSIYIQTNQQAAGPYEESAIAAWLRAGQLSPDVLACRHGASNWQPLRTLFPNPAPSAFAGVQTPRASPTPDPESIARWARLNLRNRVEVKIWFNSIGGKIFAYGGILFLPALIIIGSIAGMLADDNLEPRKLGILLAVALPFILIAFAIHLTKRNLIRYMDAEGAETLSGKKHRWEKLAHIYSKRYRRGLWIEMYFQTGKAVITTRTHNWAEVFGLLGSIPVPRRGVF